MINEQAKKKIKKKILNQCCWLKSFSPNKKQKNVLLFITSILWTFVSNHYCDAAPTNGAKQWDNLKTIELPANRYTIIGPFAWFVML